MTPAFTVRLLGAAEVPALRAMFEIFGEAFEDRDAWCTHPPDDAWLAALLAGGRCIVIAAFAEEAVIGGLTGHVLPKLGQARSECYLYDLAVAAPWRRRGVATALIDALRVVAAARGIDDIYVQAEAGDEAALALYAKHGTPREVLHFDLRPRRDAPDPDGTTGQ